MFSPFFALPFAPCWDYRQPSCAYLSRTTSFAGSSELALGVGCASGACACMPGASPRNEQLPRTGCRYCRCRGAAFVLDGSKAVNLRTAGAFRYLIRQISLRSSRAATGRHKIVIQRRNVFDCGTLLSLSPPQSLWRHSDVPIPMGCRDSRSIGRHGSKWLTRN